MMDPREPAVVRSMLVWLAKRGKVSVGERSEIPASLRNLVGANFPPFRPPELKALLLEHPEKLHVSQYKKFIWLQPLEKGGPAFPVVAVEYDYSRSCPKLSLRTAVFVQSSEQGRETPASVGYRFESPEGEGIHHYYHVQHVREMVKGRQDLALPTPSWMPVSQPAIPLHAQSPVALVVSTVMALYGRAGLNDLRGDARLWEAISPFVATLLAHLQSIDPLYFLVRGAGETPVWYKTWHTPAEFKRRADELHFQADLEVASAAAWKRAADHQRRII